MWRLASHRLLRNLRSNLFSGTAPVLPTSIYEMYANDSCRRLLKPKSSDLTFNFLRGKSPDTGRVSATWYDSRLTLSFGSKSRCSFLQLHVNDSETNCMDCSSNNRAKCTCELHVDPCPPVTSRPTPAPTPRTATPTTASASELTSVPSFAPMPPTTASGLPLPTNNSNSTLPPDSSMTTNSNSSVVPQSGSSDNRAVLIGGVVGGIVALLLLIGIVLFIVWRRRQHSSASASSALNHDATTMAVKPTSDYGPIGIPEQLAYNDIDDVRKRSK